MKKTIIFIISAIAVFCSCMKDYSVAENSNDTITLTLSVQTPEAAPITKAMGENPAISNLYVAVFDEGGYPVNYVQATDLQQIDARTWNYKVSLPTSNDPRTLHFIANSPIAEMGWQYEDNVIGNLVVSGDQDAYWQKKVLSRGIVSIEQVKSDLGTVDLVRNFAKISVISDPDSGFSLKSMKVFNVPDKGYVATKYDEGSFVENYNALSYESLKTDYQGRTPEDAVMRSDFTSSDLIPAENELASDYVYERPVPTSDAPFIIIYGRYMSSDYYYKINLQDDDDKYYPVLRNFHYKVCVKKVNVEGYSTISEAIASQGSGNITTATEYENVTNIGYGNGRLYVDRTGITVQQAGVIAIRYKFIPDVTSNTVNNTWTDSSTPTDATPVSITLSDPLIGTDHAVSPSFDVAMTDEDGWRTITLTANEPDQVYLKQQELVLLAKASDGGRLQRKILITVAPTFKLDVQCKKKVEGTKGTGMWVKVGLQEGLPESIFPVSINIEALNKTISPAGGESLPVTSGKSLSGNGKPGYMFVRTISWEEYSNAPAYDGTAIVNGTEREFTFKAIECRFTTNTNASASEIWAGGNSYFNNDSCSFINGTAYEFTNINFSEALLGTTDRTTNLSFYAPKAALITITLSNGTWDGMSSFTFNAREGNNTISGIVINDYGTGITATLSDNNTEYNDNSFTRYRTVQIPSMSLVGTIADFTHYSLGDQVALKLGLDGQENMTSNFTISEIGTTSTATKFTYTVSRSNGSNYAPRISSSSFDESTQTATITFTRYNNLASNDIEHYFYAINTTSTSESVRYPTGSWTFSYKVKDTDWQSNKVSIYLIYDGIAAHGGTKCTIERNTTTVPIYNYTISGPVETTRVQLSENVDERTPFSFKWMYNYGMNVMTAHTTMENVSTQTVTSLTFN